MEMIVPLPKSIRLILVDNSVHIHPGLALDKYVKSWDNELFTRKETKDSGDQSRKGRRDDRKNDEERKESEKAKLSERVQKPTIQDLVKMTKTEPPDLNYATLFDRWQAVLSRCRATTFAAQTIGPLTLHLARASALENAGICLHPIYGFVYLPGTGLKGMARAYAETVWLPTQEDKEKAWEDIEDVFGWAPNKDREGQIRDSHHPGHRRRENPQDENAPEIKASTGQIVFFDAWPKKWTPLEIDILNNHHPSYYQNQEPPGDWDSPIPVYFLTVQAGHEFQFALAKRRDDVDERLLDLAVQWLIGALEYEGAGAKTATGYGAFKVTELPQRVTRDAIADTWNIAIQKKRRAEFSCTLELVTPAFLAGPLQKAEDCDLRPATLRGLFRWWWRTMHAGHVDAQTLACLEAAVWGDTNSCGAVRVIIEPVAGTVKRIPVPGKRIEFNRKKQEVLRPDPDFMREQGLQSLSRDKTPGFLYISYGMDEMPPGKPEQRKQRWIVLPGARWRITFIARSGVYSSPEELKKENAKERKGINLPLDILLPQAKAALWLLTRYGGVGAKSRKGFGCFADVDVGDCHTLKDVERIAQQLRTACYVSEHNASQGIGALVPFLSDPDNNKVKEWTFDNVDLAEHHWLVLDHVGRALQEVCQKYKRHCRKEALGLPRHVRLGNNDGQKQGYKRSWHKKLECEVVWLGQKHKYAAQRKDGETVPDFENIRHAAPYFIHIGKTTEGKGVIRLVIFPCDVLPNLETSLQVLQEFSSHFEAHLDHLGKALQTRKRERQKKCSGNAVQPRGQVSYQKRNSGTKTKVKILGLREKGFDVEEEGRPPGTLTLGTPPHPLPQIGDIVEVEVHNDDPRRPQYRWSRDQGTK